MKQTAVEWLVSNISSKIDNEYWCNQKEITEWVEQAKEMEKEQLCDMYIQGRKDNHLDYYPEKHAKETYDEIYKKDKP